MKTIVRAAVAAVMFVSFAGIASAQQQEAAPPQIALTDQQVQGFVSATPERFAAMADQPAPSAFECLRRTPATTPLPISMRTAVPMNSPKNLALMFMFSVDYLTKCFAANETLGQF